MNDLMTKSLAEIVTGNNRAAGVFEKYHLDFCCRGKRSLQDACIENNINTEQVISDLTKGDRDDSCSVPLNFDQLSLTQLTEYIVATHHSYVKNEMPLLRGYLEKICSKHGGRHPELWEILHIFLSLTEEMTEHMQKEELVLFPRIRQAELDSRTDSIQLSYLESPIKVMEHEHDQAGKMLREIRTLSHNFEAPADACTTYKVTFSLLEAFETDLHQHVHLENNILFPKTIRMFESPNACSLN